MNFSSLHTIYYIKKQRKSRVWFEFNLSEKVALMCLEAEKSFLRGFPTEIFSSLYNDFFFSFKFIACYLLY